MKQYKFLPVVTAVLLAVTVFACTPLQQVGNDDDYYTDTRRAGPGRIFVDDPYYGTIVLERDPWSGRYYQVGPGGFYSPYNTRVYGGRFNNGYNNRGYYRRNNQPRNLTPQHGPQPNTEQRQTPREEARKRILGGGGN